MESIIWALFISYARADMKIGIVDMPRVVQGIAAGKSAKADLEKEYGEKKKQFEKQEADLKKKGEDLERKRSVLSEESLKAKEEELQGEFRRYRDELTKSQMALQKHQDELMAPIMEKVKKSLDKMSREKGYALIIEKSPSLLAYPAEEDITEDVIKSL